MVSYLSEEDADIIMFYTVAAFPKLRRLVDYPMTREVQ